MIHHIFTKGTILFSKKSIRSQFLFQLIVASAALIVMFSSFLYMLIQSSILEEKEDELKVFASNIISYHSLSEATSNNSDALLGLSVELIELKNYQDEYFYQENKDNMSYLILISPFNKDAHTYLRVSKDITKTHKLLKKIINAIFIINIIGFVAVIFYAIVLSRMLILPVKTLTARLSNMNEHLMSPIITTELPEEFEPLGETLNHLIKRIQNFVKYQKELFIGTAHELKTPLAVIKLKNQVTLIKKREQIEYIEAIKITNKSIDDMNKIIANILDIGRQEGAQLEKPVEVDIIEFLKNKANDFNLLAEKDKKILKMEFSPESFIATLQTQLLNQIVQNFLQNAIKFTPEGKMVKIISYQTTSGLIIDVIDEGCGVDEDVDLFAPFKREGNKSGAGLGLFLAKSASDALGANISIKNRTDGKDGTIATLSLCSKLYCALPQYKN